MKGNNLDGIDKDILRCLKGKRLCCSEIAKEIGVLSITGIINRLNRLKDRGYIKPHKIIWKLDIKEK